MKDTEINPAGIQIGMVVEVQVAFCAVSIAKERYKLLCKLHSIYVLYWTVESVSSIYDTS